MATNAASQENVVKNALADMRGRRLANGARALLAALGYESRRIPSPADYSAQEFADRFPADNPNTKSEREFKAAAQAVSILFQVTDTEIAARAQADMFAAAGFDASDESLAQSLIFAAVELRRRDNGLPYSRGHYARFAREINKRIKAPVVALFQTEGADEISIAFIGRRQSKTDAARDVLEKVSVIRGVKLSEDAHRAHTAILAELHLDERRRWMDAHGRRQNFDGLMDAWLDALDTDALNKKFYKELFEWFERALDIAQFPPNSGAERKDHIIRMLTRLIFIWFIKEKGLVHSDLFIEERVKELLIAYDRDSGDSYYRAVLQNLFFATLNTEIENRRFSNKIRADHRNPGLYRYKDLMADPDDMLAMFKRTPFVNGGLFDCLDDFGGVKANGRRMDCFTDNLHQRKEISIPNSLFFGKDNDGLIDLFGCYKFTVEENTPLEQEVALDPELLGNVFENLLAATTRETEQTARKQTGSYYTPRAVVDYMVDESLVAALAEKVAPAGDKPRLAKRLRQLLNYGVDDETAAAEFADAERKAIVAAVARLKIIDPAVGSGAFPMGILHKLTLALRRIDPDNDLWREEQVNIAVERTQQVYAAEDDAERREETQRRINADFERHKDSDFGRKLYLIQNAIYGVDIQPIAAQIAKLRFFISLAIEQERDDDADNYGIRALPNLETRFVAANTLIGLKPGGEFRLMDEDGATREINELNELRARHISTADRAAKLDIIDQEKRAQARLAAELDRIFADWDAGQLEAIERKIAALNKEQQAIVRKDETAKYEDRKARFEGGLADAKKIAAWKPLDQNAPAADWFDAEYMFDVDGGFDVVIGNPPYISVENLSAEMRGYLLSNYDACKGRTDIYIGFLEKSLSLLNEQGLMTFIIPSMFATQKYADTMRRTLIARHHIRELVDASHYRIFENAIVFNVIMSVGKRPDPAPTRIKHHYSNADFDGRAAVATEVDQQFFATLKDARFDTNPPSQADLDIRTKMWRNSVRLDEICLVAYGARLNGKSNGLRKDDYKSATPISGGKPFCEGRNIERYAFSQDGWLNYAPDEHYNPMFPDLFENEKLMLIRIVKDRLRFAYDDKGFYNSHTVINCVRLDMLTSASHTTAVRAVRNADISLASGFDSKFLLGVLNSSLVNWYFLTFLSDGLNFYPDDAKQLPVPQASASEQAALVALVDEILSAKASGGDTGELEGRVDERVLGLYGLSAGEGDSLGLAP